MPISSAGSAVRIKKSPVDGPPLYTCSKLRRYRGPKLNRIGISSRDASCSRSLRAGAAAAQLTPAATNNASVAPVTATTPASATPQGALAVQQQLQTLNNSLAALGLSAADIQKVDQVAGLINDFSPTAFTSLVYQLEAVAQNVARQAAQAQNANSNAANT
jgi:hypothetical protein